MPSNRSKQIRLTEAETSVRHLVYRLLVLLAILVAALLLLAVGASPAAAQPSESGGREEPNSSAPARPEFVEGEILVKMKEDTPGNRLGEINRANSARVEERLPSSGVRVVDLPRDLPVQAAVERYENAPGVEYAEPNYLLYLSETDFPDDSGFRFQYGLHNTGETGGKPDADIDAPEAWDGGNTVGKRDTVVAVIDSGVDISHPDLKNNIWVNEDEIPDNGKDDDSNGYVDDRNGWDFFNEDNTVYDNDSCSDDGSTETYDCDEHGTHVAGTIAAEGNNGTGVTGVNWQASIMPLKFVDLTFSEVLGDHGFPSDNAAEAIDYAVDNGAKISNNSYGYAANDKALSQTLKDAIDRAEESDHLVVAAAGNGEENNDYYGTNNDLWPSQYPASYGNSNIISVAATDHSDELWFSSNFGAATVDLGAPGVKIMSTVPKSPSTGYYKYKYGTSMASPHVAGVAALLLSENPNLNAKELKSLILQSVDKKGALKGKTVTGGRLNAAKALALSNTTVINTNDTGPGSLRNAITNANANSNLDTIRITATGTVELQTALPKLTTDMEIVGPGADQFTVKRSEAPGTPDFRIFTVNDDNFGWGKGSKVAISGLTITNGVAAPCGSESASPTCGGGIYNEGELTVEDSVISENTATHSGGGIENVGPHGNLTLKGSTVSNNTVEGTANSSGAGGGIRNLAGAFTIMDSTISENTAGWGGGISSWRDFNDYKNTVSNTTISGNVAEDRGGGMLLNAAFGDTHTMIKYSTITGNTAPTGEGSGVFGSKDFTKVFSSIIAGNTNSDVDNGFTSKGYNLVGNGNAARAFRARGDRVGITNPGRVIRGTQRNNKLNGTSGSDIIHGFRGSDTISGLGGTDIILGGSGSDTIYGGAGNDTTYSGSGNNTIRGGGGNDSLVGESGKDRLFGQGGKDRLSGGGGPDRLIAGPGVDRLFGQGGNDFLNVRDKKPKDVANGGTGQDDCEADRRDRRVSCER